MPIDELDEPGVVVAFSHRWCCVGGGAFGDDGGVDGGSRSAATPSGNSSSPSPRRYQLVHLVMVVLMLVLAKVFLWRRSFYINIIINTLDCGVVCCILC